MQVLPSVDETTLFVFCSVYRLVMEMEGNSNAQILTKESQNVKDLMEESLHDNVDSEEDLKVSLSEKITQEEEEQLKIRLEKLKKENFTLKASIRAWETTLEKQLEDLKESQSKLDEMYKDIWSERENFCSKADKFNNRYGVLSDWWQNQMRFLSELENLETEISEDDFCRREIEKLEKGIEEMQREEEGRQVAEAEVRPTTEGGSAKSVTVPRVDAAELGKEMTGEDTANELFSMVDVEKVRAATRNRNRQKASAGKLNKFSKHP